ncbi:MAG: DUF6531 domain-containing protein [Aggregatilineales bacterium]
MSTWTTELLNGQGDATPFIITKGQYNSAEDRIDGVAGVSDIFIDMTTEIPVDTEITDLSVTVEWNREVGGGYNPDTVVDVIHNGISLGKIGGIRTNGSKVRTLNLNNLSITGGTLVLEGHIDTEGGAVYLRYTSINASGNGVNLFQLEQCDHEESCCECDIHASEQPDGGEPVSLWTGDKRESMTDLHLNTPTGALTLERSFRQDKLDETVLNQVLGKGWSHNHNRYLDTTTTANTIYMYLSGDGRAHFVEDTSTRYAAKAGGTSEIIIDTNSTDAHHPSQQHDHPLRVRYGGTFT